VSNQLTGGGSEETAAAEFGANEWLVDEFYERYLIDKNSVDQSWWPILDSYHQTATGAASAAAPVLLQPASTSGSDTKEMSTNNEAPRRTIDTHIERFSLPSHDMNTNSRRSDFGGGRGRRELDYGWEGPGVYLEA
jgi:2-oxoglutarate dehydrogenase complex dehydrogenase (E1) component-like enzyme